MKNNFNKSEIIETIDRTISSNTMEVQLGGV